MRHLGDRRTKDVPEVVVTHRCGMEIHVERINRRDSGTKYALGPGHSHSVIEDGQAEVKLMVPLEVDKQQNHESSPEQGQRKCRSALWLPAKMLQAILWCGVLLAIPWTTLEKAKQCDYHDQNDEDNKRNEFTDQDGGDRRDCKRQRQAPEDSLCYGAPPEIVKVRCPGGQVTGTDKYAGMKAGIATRVPIICLAVRLRLLKISPLRTPIGRLHRVSKLNREIVRCSTRAEATQPLISAAQYEFTRKNVAYDVGSGYQGISIGHI